MYVISLNIQNVYKIPKKQRDNSILKGAKNLNKHFSKEDIKITNEHIKKRSVSFVIQFSHSVVSDSL